MKISEYKELYMHRTETVKSVDDYDEVGNIIGKHDETVVIEKPVMGLVVRDATPEQEAEMLEQQEEIKRIEANAEPVPPEIVYLSRQDFNLLDATKDNTIYYVTEENGTLTMIKGDNK